ncbi:TerC/Alx family metal homeostasis membrane protein [Clostridium tyrobutyricum]|jgi:tellurite resistance protein TerC|uniref:TerC/Alx family metal homeostasis membrane protein n=1 Tax=Clostridium tyrobutyricum TaxID=1519 RepID=UPI00068E6B30|nr:TerC/Alx family metal homeostasis membrane protein [Clostridium tyrobutyricum]MBV4414957.1 TerC/Alx family metal homeostasis membrane protein [Clostridium tyrobutyricum]MBV4421212.1 TerC/Alx family metal homeostasis membrane protein [Clostridium tyrobutyricum]MBV4428611.1 TerC/Alx family metal homeostasis membrane protein [Clostridium tyrobutyricum]MBV4431165.1 TerC/Alx family metal homeostasis membrane protein [Clostridium tyrobutyricum]MBV4441235.1 TerC/Alx family metal homeostasis membra
MSTKKSLIHLGFWIGMALIFNAGIYIFMGHEKALAFLGGYVIEQSLSLDNLFLFLIIFECFAVNPQYQKRILTYGIIGAIILRFIFIILGVTIINQFHWMLYIFGIILIISGIKMIFKNDVVVNFKNSRVIGLLEKIIPVSDKIEGEKFFIRKNKILYATPLFAILILIEASDIIFAIDSIPAVFSITTDPFIVYTSNIFAILGLRNMYFLLEKLHNNFAYVKYGVACILIFTGIKLSITFFHINVSVIPSLAIIFSILLTSIFVSIILSKNKKSPVNSKTCEDIAE